MRLVRSRTADRPLRAAGAAAVMSLVVAFLVVAVPLESYGADHGLRLEVVSTRADMVTGGNALVAVSLGQGMNPEDVHVTAGDRDVTDDFQEVGDGRLLGLVEDLDVGVTQLQAVAGRAVTTLDLDNHPISGPVFSGPQVPMYCTADGAPWNLGPVDEDCHVADVTISYRYLPTGSDELVDLDPSQTLPGDVAQTETDEGETVPYIVRIERGTINRAVYEIAMLHQPGTPLPDPWNQVSGWNGKLAYTFGGACGVGYHQATSTGNVEQYLLLSRGYAVASSTLNVFANNCDDVTSAETAMMVKEHFIESFGEPVYTVGWGASAGTMQQLLIANNYPGIIDGVIGEIGYPDERTTTTTGHDCRALNEYWDSLDAADDWTEAEKLAVTGHASMVTCLFGYMFFDGVDDPQRGCSDAIPEEDRWSEENPDGIRCTIADQVKNVYGVDQDGHGRRIVADNTGLQFGFEALIAGEITAEQFLDLNESIGGVDKNGDPTAERTSVDSQALERAYATGRVNMFTGGLLETPIIEFRGYTDPRGDFHDRVRSVAMRERVLAAHGDAQTHVSWTGPDDQTISAQMREEALDAMDAWLLAIDADEDRSRAAVIAARPAGLSDGCYTADGDKINEVFSADPGTDCNALYPYHGSPRQAAGGPLSHDVLKCELTDPVPEDYPAEFQDAATWDRLEAIFPDGVCDWSEPSTGFTELAGTWLSFTAEGPLAPVPAPTDSPSLLPEEEATEDPTTDPVEEEPTEDPAVDPTEGPIENSTEGPAAGTPAEGQPSGAAPQSGGSLPSTGADVGAAVAVVAGLLVLGMVTLALARRRSD